MRTLEQLKQIYADKCALLGSLVAQQRKLHAQAEELIKQIEQLEAEAAQSEATKEEK